MILRVRDENGDVFYPEIVKPTTDRACPGRVWDAEIVAFAEVLRITMVALEATKRSWEPIEVEMYDLPGMGCVSELNRAIFWLDRSIREIEKGPLPVGAGNEPGNKAI